MTKADKFYKLASVNGRRKYVGSTLCIYSTYNWHSNNKFNGYQTTEEMLDWGSEAMVGSLSERSNDFKDLRPELQEKLKKAAAKKFKKHSSQEQETIVNTYLGQLMDMIDDLPTTIQDVVYEVKLRA